MGWSLARAAWLTVFIATAGHAEPLQAGVAFLLHQQDAEGAFGTARAEEPEVATHEALEALRVVGLGASAEARRAESYLAGLPLRPDAELLLRNQLSVPAMGPTLALQGLRTHAAGLEATDALHTALVLRALGRTGQSHEQPLWQLAWQLALSANAEGCYAYTEHDASVALTAEAVLALRAHSYNALVAAKLSATLSCLKARQQPDGSFGPISDTALAMLALQGAPGQHSQALASARQYLLALQREDGSWGGVRQSALAIQALGNHRPDWRVVPDESGRGVLLLSSARPLQGADISASLDVENRSNALAPEVNVRFIARPMDGQGEVVLQEVSLGMLDPGRVVRVSARLPTAGLAGRYVLRAVVDPDGAVPELEELNNEASAPLEVRLENDLALTSQGLSFTAASAEQVQVEVRVRNLGAPLPRDVQVDVYKGAAGVGGVKLGSGRVAAGLAPNATASVRVDWSTQGLNGPTAVHAVVDPEGLLTEADEQNNHAFRFYHPGTSLPVDLYVVQGDIAREPAHVLPRQSFTLRARVLNASANDANRVLVGLYAYGSPGAQPQGLVELPLVPAQGSAVAEFQLFLDHGATLQLVVDPEQRLADTNRSNNSALHGVSLSRQAPHELAVTSLSSSKSFIEDGVPVTLKATVANNGSTPTETMLRLVDPEQGRTLAELPLTLARQERRDLTLGSFLLPRGDTVLLACVDPDDEVDEYNENDNCQELGLSEQSVQLSVHPRELTVSPVGAAVGEKVRLGATVRNSEGQPASAVLEWWQGRPSFPEGVKLGETPLRVPASGSAAASFDWVRAEGPVEFFVRIVRVTPRESTHKSYSRLNNVAGRHLFLDSLVGVDLGLRYQRVREVRAARLSGQQAPELVIGYEGSNPFADHRAGVALFQKTADGYSRQWTRDLLPRLLDVVVADLDSDGEGEVIAASTGLGQTTGGDVRITALRPDGSTRWETAFVRSCATGPDRLELGDVNGDGTADLVLLDSWLRVLSGKDGSVLMARELLTNSGCGQPGALVLDVDGDGANEVLAVMGVQTALLDRNGSVLWTSPAGGSGAAMAVVDLDLDGNAELVLGLSRSASTALDVRTGKRLAMGAFLDGNTSGLSLGALRQDGLAYLTRGTNSYQPHLAAFGPELGYLWDRLTPAEEATDSFVTTLADLLGHGRPQVLAHSSVRPLVMLEGRGGQSLLEFPGAMPLSGGAVDGSITYQAERPAVVADLDADGHSELLISRNSECSTEQWFANQWPEYGCNQVLVFASAHWSRQPTVWPTRFLRRGQVGEDLRVGTDYRWWTKAHSNTWNQQFDQEPARLLPDLSVAARDLTAAPTSGTAGEPLRLSALVRNLGGLPASDVKVAFYDGDPEKGGRHLGDSVLSGPLAERKGSATASLTWTAYPEGEHHLYMVVNPEGALEESGRENNTASLRVFVQAGTRLCDLAVDASRLSSRPQAPTAGQAVLLDATVKSVGALGCGASLLTLFDDSGAVGSAQLPALAPGQEATVSVAAIALPGSRLLRFVADEAGATLDADRGNNEAVLRLDVPEADTPDLLVASLGASPSPAFAGEAVVVKAVVRNQGAPSPASAWRLRRGTLTLAQGALPPLLSAESTEVTVSLTAPDEASTLTLEVDPEGVLPEFLEANNSASTPLDMTPAQLLLTVRAQVPGAGPETPVGFEVTIRNQAPVARELRLDARVVGPVGEQKATLLSSAREVLGAQEATSRALVWDTGRSAPGAYRLEVTASSEGRLIARGEALVRVLAESAASTRVVTDRGMYRPGQQVLISQRVANESRNAPLSEASVHVSVRDEAGTVLFQALRPLPALPAEGYRDMTDLFHLSPHLRPGSYSVATWVRDSAGVILASAQAAWTLADPLLEALTVSTRVGSPFGIGRPLPVEVTLANAGGVDLSERLLEVLLVGAQGVSTGAAPLSGARANVSVAAGQLATVWLSVPTAGLPQGDMLLVVRLEGRTVEHVLVTGMEDLDQEPPVITVEGVTDLLLTREDVTPLISVQEENLLSLLAWLDEQPFTSGQTVSAEGAHVLRVEAEDVGGRRSEVTVRFTVDKTPPKVVVTGVSEGAEEAAFTISYLALDANLASVEAKLDGEAFGSGGKVEDIGPHELVVTASDKAGNTETVRMRFEVVPPSPRFGHALCATRNLSLRNNTSVRGAPGEAGASVAADGEVLLEGHTSVSGDVVAGGGLTMANVARVEGRAWYGTHFTRRNRASVGQGAELVSPPPRPCACGYDLTRVLEALRTYNDNASLESLPDSARWWREGALVLEGASVTLPEGRYFASRLVLSSGAVLAPAPGARVELFIEGEVSVQGGASLGGPPSSEGSLLVLSGARATQGQAVRVVNNAEAALRLYAPEADVTLSNNSRLHGAVVGRDVLLENRNEVILTPGPQAMPAPLACE